MPTALPFSPRRITFCSPGEVRFSRSGWNCVDVCLYMLMAMFCLMRGIVSIPLMEYPNRSAWLYFAAAGLFCALGLYGYPPGRVITFVVLAFFPITWFLTRRFKPLLMGYALLLAVEVLLFAPEAVEADPENAGTCRCHVEPMPKPRSTAVSWLAVRVRDRVANAVPQPVAKSDANVAVLGPLAW